MDLRGAAMIGAVTYELVATADGRMEGFAGRLLHAAFFRHLAACSAALSEAVHDGERAKPFTSSPLIRLQRLRVPAPSGNGRRAADGRGERMIFEKAPFAVAAGERFFWRVTALQDDVLAAALHLAPGTELQVGRVPFSVLHVFADGTHESGVLAPEDLIADALAAPPVHELSLHFRSPVTFRRGALDYPVPAPELVFPSLASKWQAHAMPADIDTARVQEMAARVAISDWTGRTQRIYFGQHHGASGCLGDFTYSLKALDDDERRILILLAEYATFSGTGRLAAQGFGQTRVTFPRT